MLIYSIDFSKNRPQNNPLPHMPPKRRHVGSGNVSGHAIGTVQPLQTY